MAATQKIGPSNPKTGLTLVQENPGLAILNIQASLMHGGWANGPIASGVLSIHLGNKFHSHVVVLQNTQLTYSVILGHRPKGKLALTLKWEDALSLSKSPIAITGISLRHPKTEIENTVWAGSPFIAISASRLNNDFPMALGWTGKDNLSYQVYFTNEDGGTGRFPALLMGKYQRLADIEQALYQRDKKWFFQGPGHRDLPLENSRRWGRPALSVCTDNGMFCPDKGEHPIVLSYLPLPMPEGETRERLMDLHPWMTRLVNEEAAREKDSFGKPKITQDKVVKDVSAADARQYLYIDFVCRSSAPDKSVALVATLKQNPKQFKSDTITGIVANPADLRKTCDGGLQRAVIKLPFGTIVPSLASVSVQSKGSPPAEGHFIRAFLLDDTYSPVALPGIQNHSIASPGWTQ